MIENGVDTFIGSNNMRLIKHRNNFFSFLRVVSKVSEKKFEYTNGYGISQRIAIDKKDSLIILYRWIYNLDTYRRERGR